MMNSIDLSSNNVLPAKREAITLTTSDGLRLVGELALPENAEPKATIICLHPNPTGGGMMDSHLFRKAAWRLPALADLAVLRFNFRGTTSASGTSEGTYDEGRNEKFDFQSALKFAIDRKLPNIWAIGWSFGTDVTIKYANVDPVMGGILFSPPLKWSNQTDLQKWAESKKPIVALVPELDEYLRPLEAKKRFALIPQAEVIAIPEGKHLWIGEKFVRIAWDEALKRIRPEMPTLNWQWSGPIKKWDDLTGKLTSV